MTQKISDLFISILTKSSVWFVLIIWHLLDTSNYEFNLFLGNLIASLFIILITTLITNRVPFAILLTLALESVLNFASVIKAEFFATVLTYYDLTFLFNIYKLSGQDFVFSYLTMSFVIYSIMISLFISYLFLKTPVLIARTSYTKRIIMLVIAFVLVKLAIYNLKDKQSYVHQWLRNTQESNMLACNKNYESQNLERAICYGMGPFLDILSGIAENKIRPIHLSETSELIKSRLVNFEQGQNKIDKLPNIILVLNESTFDPSYLDYEFAKSLKFSFFDSNEYLKAKGILKVHTFGGGSCLSEFPSVTGIVHDIFKGPVTYPFINIARITKSSLFRELKKLGYYSIVIYPQDKKFINAEQAFKILGADRVVGTSDYNYKPADWRGVSEKFISEMIDAEIANAPKNMPIFVSVATIRNHGPHERSAPDILGCSNDLDDIQCSKMNDYINRLKETDKEWMEYTRKIMQQDSKTVIIHFGDHLPSFEGEMDKFKFKYPDIAKQDIYRTFYNIRANFDIGDYTYPILDISYFPSVILDIVGNNNSEFYKAASFIRSQCNGLLLECDVAEKNLLESYKALIAEQLQL